jgi:hypothetical protein
MYSNQNNKFNIPYLPITNNPSIQLLINHIYKSIVDEATAADFYSLLLTEVPDALHYEFLKHAYKDE